MAHGNTHNSLGGVHRAGVLLIPKIFSLFDLARLPTTRQETRQKLAKEYAQLKGMFPNTSDSERRRIAIENVSFDTVVLISCRKKPRKAYLRDREG
jgi:hypothetical protein